VFRPRYIRDMVGTPPPPDQPPPGWYPDPTGQRRYWNGQAWHHQVAASPQPGQVTNRRPFVKLAIASAVTCIVAFVVMQIAFNVGDAWLQVLGFVLFAVFLVSAVVTIVGVVGAIVGRVK
jgi:cytosine/uracil/thiamine/allantoin permease